MKWTHWAFGQKMNMILVLAGIGVAGLSYTGDTNALFTAQTTVGTNQLSTGTLNLTASPASALLQITNLVPGDTITRTLSLQNSGNIDFTYNMKNSSVNNTLLYTDTTKGLQLDIKKGGVSYFSGPVSQLNANTAGDLSLASGATDVLTFTLSLPMAADNPFQSLSDTINFTFNATQTPGTAR